MQISWSRLFASVKLFTLASRQSALSNAGSPCLLALLHPLRGLLRWHPVRSAPWCRLCCRGEHSVLLQRQKLLLQYPALLL